MKIITYINLHKILAAPIVALGLTWYFDNWSMEAFIYLGLYGTCWALWLIMSALFPDHRFQEAQPPRIGLPFAFLPLAGYAQMNVTVGLGALSFNGHGEQDAQTLEFCR
jgi:hypothetical protein